MSDIEKLLYALEKRVSALESRIEKPHARLTALERSMAEALAGRDNMIQMLTAAVAQLKGFPQ